jgi:prevent-host-death family protein
MQPIDLEDGIVPISRAASSLAALLKKASTTGKPIIVTQKGYPTGVILSIEVYTTLRNLLETERQAAPPEA